MKIYVVKAGAYREEWTMRTFFCKEKAEQYLKTYKKQMDKYDHALMEELEIKEELCEIREHRLFHAIGEPCMCMQAEFEEH